MRRSRSLSRFRMRSSRMTSLYRTDISRSNLSISLILRNPPLSDPWSNMGRESHDPDVHQPRGGGYAQAGIKFDIDIWDQIAQRDHRTRGPDIFAVCTAAARR